MNIESEIISAVIVAALYLLLFGTMELWSRRTSVAREVTRKGVHIGGGFIALTLPYLFESHWSVLILGSLLTIALIIARWRSLLPSVQGVERSTYGEILYPAAIYLTFLWAMHEQRPLYYIIAILTLALADGLAGIVGERFKRVTFRVAGGEKSLGGSATFFAVATAIILIAFDIDGTQTQLGSIVIALIVAFVATAVEAASTHGTDNVTVPLATLGMLLAIEAKTIERIVG
ncbi:MAG: hypothetical protein H7X80_02540 [bacterium]|nr:hypothetical protein [Candidatus Kapabacteria bacterium]